MKKWAYLFCCLFSILSLGVQAKEMLIEGEDIEHCIHPDMLQLVAGKLYMSCEDVLVPLKSVRYTDEGVFAITKKALMLVHCPKCNRFYILQFGHECNG